MEVKQELRQRMLGILKETKEYYEEDTERRAVDKNGECIYTDKHGNHCAIGRLLRPEFQDIDWEYNADTGVSQFDVDDYLEEDYQTLPYPFWCKLQDLHDLPSNWEVYSNGMSKIGAGRYNRFVQRIEAGEYDE